MVNAFYFWLRGYVLDLIIFSSFQNLIIFIDITIKKIKHTFPSEKVAAYWRIFLTQNLSIILCYAHEQVLITFWTSFPCWKAGMITFWTMFVAEKLAWSPYFWTSFLVKNAGYVHMSKWILSKKNLVDRIYIKLTVKKP